MQFDFATTDLKSSRYELSTDVIINSLASRFGHIRVSFAALATAHIVEMCPDLADSTYKDDSTRGCK